MATKPRPPVRPTYGRVPGFGKRPRRRRGACPTCGARPPCEVPDPTTADDDNAPFCRDSTCDYADFPHPHTPGHCPKT